MEGWQNAKSRFLKFMNGPVYESETTVHFHLDEESKNRKVDSFIEWAYNDCDELLGEFFATEKTGFYDNKITVPFIMPNNEEIPVGMKIGKALGRYFKDYIKQDVLEEVRLEMSRIIQEDIISGKLCISVHPLDYLSSSENNHNWRSCHALDGEYRGGNLSYMLDECTVMAYLKSDKPDDKLPRFPSDVPWNDKKWRCLFFFDFKRGIVYAGRQYPFSSQSALNAVEIMFSKLKFFTWDYRDNPFAEWQHSIYKGDVAVNKQAHYLEAPYMFYNCRITPLAEIVQNGENSLQFNDLIQSSYYVPSFYEFYPKSKMAWHLAPPMIVGRKVPCVHCGKNNIHPNEAMLCEDCMIQYTNTDNEEFGYCAACGEHILYRIEYNYRNEYYCNDCFNELFQPCEVCGLTHDINEMYWHDGEDENFSHEGYVCSVCEHGLREENSGNPFF